MAASTIQYELGKAEYFFEELAQATKMGPGPTTDHEWNLVRYNLSAFLHAANDLVRLLKTTAPKPDGRIWEALLTKEGEVLDAMGIVEAENLFGAGFRRNTGLAPVSDRDYASAQAAHLADQRAALAANDAALFGEAPVRKVGVLSPEVETSGGDREPLLPKCRAYLDLLREMVRVCQT